MNLRGIRPLAWTKPTALAVLAVAVFVCCGRNEPPPAHSPAAEQADAAQLAALKEQVNTIHLQREQASNEIFQLKVRVATLMEDLEEQKKTKAVPIPSKPAVSEGVRNRAITLIEKTAKLDAMTSQGVTHTAFRDQLAEVKAALDTMGLLGWPKEWSGERADFDSTADAWNRAIYLWKAELDYATESRRSRLELLDGIYSNHTNDVERFASGSTTYGPALISLQKRYISKIQALANDGFAGGEGRLEAVIQFFLATGSLYSTEAQRGLRESLKE